MEKRRIKDIDELTPIDTYYKVGGFDKMYFKREDLFLPYDDMPMLGGGKVKQTISLFDSMKNELRKYNGIITYIQVDSPQGIIISKVAKDNDLKMAITIGVKDVNKAISLHKSLKECVKVGAEIIPIGVCRSNIIALQNTLPIAKEKNYYTIHFGINVDDNPQILTEKIINQVENIPDELDVLISPTGSGIQTAAILAGIKKFNKKVKRVISIQISGLNVVKRIDNILDKLGASDMKYEMIIDKTYPYGKHIHTKICCMESTQSMDLNIVYESKAWEYLKIHKKELNIDRNSEILFWNVGNNNFNYL